MAVVFEIGKWICMSWCRSDGLSHVENFSFGDDEHTAEIRHMPVNHGARVDASKRSEINISKTETRISGE